MLSASNDRASASGNADSFTDISQFEHVPRRYYGRYLASVVILAIVAYIVVAFARGQIDWVVVGRFLTAKSILKGLGNTIVMTILAMALGIVLGVIVAIMRLSTNPVLQAVAQAYVWLFRGTPVILQLLLWFNLALVFPVMGIPGLFEVRTVDIMTPFLAALLGLGVSQGAYTSEVVRAGLLSVDTGQYEAAKSIGMPKLQAVRGDAAQRREHLLCERSRDRIADGRGRLVSGGCHGTFPAAVPSRIALCARRGTRVRETVAPPIREPRQQ